MQICLHFLCQKKEEKKENYFCVKVEKDLLLLSHRDGEFMWTGTNPSPKRKKNQLRVLGGVIS
jgi:hypothetical protein